MEQGNLARACEYTAKLDDLIRVYDINRAIVIHEYDRGGDRRKFVEQRDRLVKDFIEALGKLDEEYTEEVAR